MDISDDFPLPQARCRDPLERVFFLDSQQLQIIGVVETERQYLFPMIPISFCVVHGAKVKIDKILEFVGLYESRKWLLCVLVCL